MLRQREKQHTLLRSDGSDNWRLSFETTALQGLDICTDPGAQAQAWVQEGRGEKPAASCSVEGPVDEQR